MHLFNRVWEEERETVERRKIWRHELTRNGEVGVGLNFSGLVAGEALEHSSIIRQEAVNLQTATRQHSVSRGLHRAYGHCVFIPYNVRLRDTWEKHMWVRTYKFGFYSKLKLNLKQQYQIFMAKIFHNNNTIPISIVYLKKINNSLSKIKCIFIF